MDRDALARHAPGHHAGPRRPTPGLVEGSVSLEELEAVWAAAGTALALPDDEVPRFGSPAWAALHDDDYRREAAVLRAALAWWASEVGLGAPASREHVDRLVAAEHIALSADMADEVRRQGLVLGGPTHDEIVQRRLAVYAPPLTRSSGVGARPTTGVGPREVA